LAEGETTKTATLTLTPPIIFLAKEKHAGTSTNMTVPLAQAKGETNEVTTIQKSTQCDYSVFGQVRICCPYLYSIVNKCTTSKKGELSATSHDGSEHTLLPIMRDKKNKSQHPDVDGSTPSTATKLFKKCENGKRFKLSTVRNKPCGKCYFGTAMEHQDVKGGPASYDATVTPSIADNTINPNSITFLIGSLADDDPSTTVSVCETTLICTPTPSITAEDHLLVTTVSVGPMQIKVATTTLVQADDKTLAVAHATEYAKIDGAMNIFCVAHCTKTPDKIEDTITKIGKLSIPSLTRKLPYAASAVAQQVNAADSEPPLTTVMITTRADGDSKTSGYIGEPLLFTHAIVSDPTSLSQREYSAGNTPPATNIDTTKLADDDPRMASADPKERDRPKLQAASIGTKPRPAHPTAELSSRKLFHRVFGVYST
jgi:hypothetical protein